MKRVLLSVSILLSITCFAMFALPSFSHAAELSSVEIKKIEEGIKLIKEKGRGKQRKGHRALRSIGPSSASFLIEVLEDKEVNRESKALVCDLLGEFKAKEGVDILIRTLKNKSYTTRAAACKALGNIADRKATKPLLGMLDDDEAEVRAAALYAMVNFDDRKMVDEGIRFLKDDEYDIVRIAAATLLNSKVSPKSISVVRKALIKDRAVKVRRLCANTLGELKKNESVEDLTEALIEDSDNFVREEAAVALGKIGDKRAVGSLIQALKDEYKDVKLRAYYSLKNITGERFERDYNAWMNWYKMQKREKIK